MDVSTFHYMLCFIIILLVVLSNSKRFTNPTSNITCGKYDNCVIHCSAPDSCTYGSNVNAPYFYFVFNNDWSVTDKQYNATLICGPYACNKIKIFGNRTSSIKLIFNGTYLLDAHILFGNYNKGPQVAHISCIHCADSEFYYSSLEHNISSINSPSSGIVHHECYYCEQSHSIYALNIYQLRLSCYDFACRGLISVFPPLHNNAKDSFILNSNYTGLIYQGQDYWNSHGNFMFYFLNGLYGKQFICDLCAEFPYSSTRIYCGVTYEILEDAQNILIGTESKQCASIYDNDVKYVPYTNRMFFFNSHRFHHTDYDDYLQSDDTLFIMADTYLPNETYVIDTIQFPANVNIFILCGHCSDILWNGSHSNVMSVVHNHDTVSALFYGGSIFNSFAFQHVRYNEYHLKHTDIIYMGTLEDKWSIINFMDYPPDLYEHSTFYIGHPSQFTLDCAQDSDSCDSSFIYAETGHYEYLPIEWKIMCCESYCSSYNDYNDRSCNPFHVIFADLSTCELVPLSEDDDGSMCTKWEKGPPTLSPTRSPTIPSQSPTEHHSIFNTHSLLTSSIYSIISITAVVFVLLLIAIIGYIHKCNATKACCMKCCKPADDSRPFVLITMALSIWDFLSDWNWAFSVYDDYKYYSYPSMGLNVVSWLLNLTFLFKLVCSFNQNQNVSGWVRSYALFLVVLTMISGKASAAISLCNCHLFGLSLFEMGLPLFRIQLEISRWKILFNTVFTNIPQIVLQMLYVSECGSLDAATLFALLSGTASIVLTVSTFVIRAGTKWNPKMYEIKVHISAQDAMHKLLRKRRYLRSKTAFIIAECVGVASNCIEVENMCAPLIVTFCINDEREEDVLLDLLNANVEQLKLGFTDLFSLEDDFEISIKSKEIQMSTNKAVKISMSVSSQFLDRLIDDRIE